MRHITFALVFTLVIVLCTPSAAFAIIFQQPSPGEQMSEGIGGSSGGNGAQSVTPGSGGSGVSGGQFQFQPIIPNSPLSPTSGSGASLTAYLNQIFKVAVAVAVVLAVIRIIIKGFQYMTTDAVTGKKEALGGIRAALLGLILLLASYVILWIINPALVSLSVLGLSK